MRRSRDKDDARRAAMDLMKANAALEELWAKIPDVACKGLCASACGPIGMSDVERARIMRRHRLAIPDGVVREDTMRCPALVQERCSVYPDRPTICRTWGASEDMPCSHGCVPEGGRLSHRDTMLIVNASVMLDRTGLLGIDPRLMDLAISDPVVGPLLLAFTKGDKSVVLELAHALTALWGSLTEEDATDAAAPPVDP